ncbi:MAG: hypothetical protein [Bacteriophage sp.]|nr:MAG: hypothetical protein [Bacteriophage sp.]
MSKFTQANGAAFSSNRDDWETPEDLFEQIEHLYGPFTLDPASSDKNAKTVKHFTIEDDGLKRSWKGETVFVNPPYGRKISEWVRKAFEEHFLNGVKVVMLLPARTDTKWFHDYIYKLKDVEILFLEGRVKFEIDGKSLNSAPFPSMVVVYK